MLFSRRNDDRRSTDTESYVERRVTSMWHIGVHYLLPFSQLAAEEHHRNVVSQDDAGIAACFYASLGL